MQQLEDLAKIIRDKEKDLEDANTKINDLTEQNRQLHK